MNNLHRNKYYSDDPVKHTPSWNRRIIHSKLPWNYRNKKRDNLNADKFTSKVSTINVKMELRKYV